MQEILEIEEVAEIDFDDRKRIKYLIRLSFGKGRVDI